MPGMKIILLFALMTSILLASRHSASQPATQRTADTFLPLKGGE
jgi:hypothetical protein